MWPLPVAQRAIIVAGCLAMVYTQLTLSPATIEYARHLGANGLHFGLLGAVPTGTLFLQFVAALLANHLQYRRWTWLLVSLVQRLVLVPVALGPWLFPAWSDQTWIWWLIAATAVNHALLHFAAPLWLSWMGDYLPREGMNRFWGARHLWMQWAAALSLFGCAVFLLKSGITIRPAFAWLMIIGAAFGVADVLLFLKVDEPPVERLPEPKLGTVLAAPFRHGDFRTFIWFTSFWHFAAMLSAPFISLYLLDHVGMDLWSVLLLWTFSWAGGAVFSNRLGDLADRYGHRPVLILCTAFKSLNVIALLVVPREPALAYWILVPVFMVDSLLNAGIAIANNGFLLKHSPGENRTMFIAAGTAVAGMVGGVASVVGGALLAATADWSRTWGGTVVCNYHLVFAASVALRVAAAVLAVRVREPESHDTLHVVVCLVGVTPLRMLRFPLGLYRTLRTGGPRVPGRRDAAHPSRRRRVPARAVVAKSVER